MSQANSKSNTKKEPPCATVSKNPNDTPKNKNDRTPVSKPSKETDKKHTSLEASSNKKPSCPPVHVKRRKSNFRERIDDIVENNKEKEKKLKEQTAKEGERKKRAAIARQKKKEEDETKRQERAAKRARLAKEKEEEEELARVAKEKEEKERVKKEKALVLLEASIMNEENLEREGKVKGKIEKENKNGKKVSKTATVTSEVKKNDEVNDVFNENETDNTDQNDEQFEPSKIEKAVHKARLNTQKKLQEKGNEETQESCVTEENFPPVVNVPIPDIPSQFLEKLFSGIKVPDNHKIIFRIVEDRLLYDVVPSEFDPNNNNDLDQNKPESVNKDVNLSEAVNNESDVSY